MQSFDKGDLDDGSTTQGIAVVPGENAKTISVEHPTGEMSCVIIMTGPPVTFPPNVRIPPDVERMNRLLESSGIVDTFA